MIEALWTVEYGTGETWKNGGVLVFETGRVFGGDSFFYVTGDYDATGRRFTARLSVVHYHGQRLNAFGDEAAAFEMTLTGERHGDEIRGTLTREGFEDLRARLTWRSDLPTGIA